MRTLCMESNELKHIIEQKIRHSYLEKYIQKPFIDNNKVFILNYLYNDLQMPLQRKQQYITTIMLVQIALDTHELVPANGSNEMSNTEKQLSVLAGDYYSGLYYLFLSELEDMEMIQVLATAIKNINEQKMKLFYENIETIDELFNTMLNIESILFTQVAKFIDVDKNIIPIIQHFLLIQQLYKEKDKLHEDKFSYIVKYIESNVPDANFHTISNIIDLEIENQTQKLDALLLHLPYRFIALKNLIRDKVTITYNASVAEEG